MMRWHGSVTTACANTYRTCYRYLFSAVLAASVFGTDVFH